MSVSRNHVGCAGWNTIRARRLITGYNYETDLTRWKSRRLENYPIFASSKILLYIYPAVPSQSARALPLTSWESNFNMDISYLLNAQTNEDHHSLTDSSNTSSSTRRIPAIHIKHIPNSPVSSAHSGYSTTSYDVDIMNNFSSTSSLSTTSSLSRSPTKTSTPLFSSSSSSSPLMGMNSFPIQLLRLPQHRFEQRTVHTFCPLPIAPDMPGSRYNIPLPLPHRAVPSIPPPLIDPPMSSRTIRDPLSPVSVMVASPLSSTISKKRRRALRQVGQKHRDKKRNEVDTLTAEVEELTLENERLQARKASLRAVYVTPCGGFELSPKSTDTLGLRYVPGILALVLFEFIAHRRFILPTNRQRKEIVYPDYDDILQQIPSQQLLVLFGVLHMKWSAHESQT